MLYLDENLKQHFSADQPLFDQLMALEGECFRHQKGRKTQRVKLGEKTYFIKQHRGVGIKEILKNLLQLKLPVISAKNEWQAIEKLQQLGIAVPGLAGYGERGINPAKRESFVLMEELTPAISLEDLSAKWKGTPPATALKRKLIERVADISRTMHGNGINHRDYYICHFLLNDQNDLSTGDVELSLIDLHRAQIRHHTPLRWVIKDLAGLYFSSKDAGLTKRDLLRFIKRYHNQDLRKILKSKHRFWLRVKERGDQLYREHAK